MTFSIAELKLPKATNVTVSEDTLMVDLSDGRTVSVPIAWFPRLATGTREERSNWRLVGGGEGIHWPDIDEDVSVEALIAGRPSQESQSSLQEWLRDRLRTVQSKPN